MKHPATPNAPRDRAPHPENRGPSVPFPPPLPFAAGLALSVLLDWVAPLGEMPRGSLVTACGALFVALGVTVALTGVLTFRRARTAVYPNRPARCLVDTGLFARTRNPMYLGMALAYTGALLLIGSWWAVALLPGVLLVMRTQVIAREERHLHEQFPVDYAAYCAKVPRWL